MTAFSEMRALRRRLLLRQRFTALPGRFSSPRRRVAASFALIPERLRVLVSVLTVAAVLALAGCDYFGYTPIKDINAFPGSFEGKEVRIKGRAGVTFQLLGLKAFKLTDGTGDITVTTQGAVPRAGDTVAVKGVVRSALIVGGKSAGLRVEETRRLR
jgi:hypothetical protein